MSLEVGDGFISGLVVTNPVGATDPKSQGDDHIRLIKTALKGTFPNLTGAVTPTQTAINQTCVGTGGTFPAINGSALTNLNATNLASGTVADARLSANVPLLNAANVFTASQTVKAAAASLALWSTAAGAGLQRWEVVADTDGKLRVFTRTDAGTATENALAISRNSSAEVTLFAVTADNITLNGVDATDFARLSQANEFLAIQKITAAAAVQRFRESGAASDEKEWFIGGLNSGRFRMGTESDAVSGGNDFLVVDRTGTTVDSVALTATAITLNGATTVVGGLNGEPVTRDISDTGSTASSDRGIVIRMTSGSSKTFTLDGDPPTNAVVVLDNSSGAAWTIAASGTLIWALTAAAGSRTLADDGLAVAVHRGSGVWIINGGGLS
jgi:hypothetical protein